MSERKIKASLRQGNINDAVDVLELQKEILSESEFMISIIEEYEETSEQLRNWIEKILKNKIEKLIVAESKGQIVGLIVCQKVIKGFLIQVHLQQRSKKSTAIKALVNC
ncbi:hypothetical protein [Neobacillus mesonae]|uniref:hypothetical protein n=1 Tax=Neobacillus mesonae TaxID=1193713 RepID=UPI002E224F9D